MFIHRPLDSPHGRTSHCFDPVKMGTNGAVVTNHPLASSVGIRVLQEGGNAVDAATAISFAIAVAEPAGSGIGGDAFIMVYERASRSVQVINGSGAAPLAATADDVLARVGSRAASVPGVVDAVLLAHGRWGKLPLEQCIAPSLALCEDGVPVSLHQAEITAGYAHLREGAAAGIFAPGGEMLRTGALRRNPDLAKTYRSIAKEGRDVFYRGPIAEAIVRFSKATGGLLTMEDFARHSVRFERPIASSYRGFDIFEAGPVSCGHVLLQELNMIERFPMREFGYLSPEAVNIMVEAKRMAFMDREAFLGDPDHTRVPMEGLLSKDYAAERAELISSSKAAAGVAPGNPWRYQRGGGQEAPLPQAGLRARTRFEDTTHFCVIDGQGNAVGQLQSLKNLYGAQVVVPETGILLNNRMHTWNLEDGHPNQLVPGKRARHTMNPVMVFKNDGAGDELCWVLGTPGGDAQVQVNLQVISALIDRDLNEAEAVQAPRWVHDQDGVHSDYPHRDYDRIVMEDRFGEETMAELGRYGHQIHQVGAWGGRGSVGIIGRDAASGVLCAAVDLRRDGQALVY